MRKLFFGVAMVATLTGCAGQQINWSKAVAIGEQLGNAALRGALAYYSVRAPSMSATDRLQWDAYLSAFTAATQTGQPTEAYEQRYARFQAGY